MKTNFFSKENTTSVVIQLTSSLPVWAEVFKHYRQFLLGNAEGKEPIHNDVELNIVATDLALVIEMRHTLVQQREKVPVYSSSQP